MTRSKPLPIRALFKAYRWHLLAIIALVFVHGAVHADEATGKQSDASTVTIPSTVQAILDKGDADIAKVNAATVERLKKAEADAARKNNLDLAVWINKRITALQATIKIPKFDPNAPHDLIITEAKFGSGSNMVDATVIMQRKIKNGHLNWFFDEAADHELVGSLGDPALHVFKQVDIDYTVDGTPAHASVMYGTKINLP